MTTSSSQPSDHNPAIVDLRAIEAATAVPPAEPPKTAPPLILAAPTPVASPEELARRAAAEVAATEQARAVIAASSSQETAAVNPVVTPFLPPVAIESSDSATPSSEAAIVPVVSTETVSEKPTSESPPAAGIVVSTENPEISPEAQTADAKNARFDAAVQVKSIIPENADIDSILSFMKQDAGFPTKKIEAKATESQSSPQASSRVIETGELSAIPLSATTVEATIAAQNTPSDTPTPQQKPIEQPGESVEPADVDVAAKP